METRVPLLAKYLLILANLFNRDKFDFPLRHTGKLTPFMTEVPLYRNQPIDWFLYDRDFYHERVNVVPVPEANLEPRQTSKMERLANIINSLKRSILDVSQGSEHAI